jgi:hypothetical protein
MLKKYADIYGCLVFFKHLSVPSNVLSRDLAVLQSIADLAGEIAALEQEVIRKELHLLSLYRRAFDQHLSDSCSVSEVHNSGCLLSHISSMKSNVLRLMPSAGGSRNN